MDFIRLYIKWDSRKIYDNKINLDGDAGVDLFFPNRVNVPKGETLLVDFEMNCKMVHVHELEDGSLLSGALKERLQRAQQSKWARPDSVVSSTSSSELSALGAW